MATQVKVWVEASASLPETALLAQKGPLSAFLVDISRFGMGLLSHDNLPKGSLIDVELPRTALPIVMDPPPKGMMRVRGHVVHTLAQGEYYRVGISLDRIDEVDQFLLQKMTPGYERRRAPRVPLLKTSSPPE